MTTTTDRERAIEAQAIAISDQPTVHHKKHEAEAIKYLLTADQLRALYERIDELEKRVSEFNDGYSDWMSGALRAEKDHGPFLRDAAQAIVDRWDTPTWKDIPATAAYINDLRKALVAK